MAGPAINDLLEAMVEREASDLHLQVGSPPTLRVLDNLSPFDLPPLTAEETEEMASSLLKSRQKKRFLEDLEIDIAYALEGVGRFRIDVYTQRGTVALAVRWVKAQIPSFAELGLPAVLAKVSLMREGFVLVTGTTGAGKSTTQASMIDYINQNRNCRIVTIEDPIEFAHEDKKAMVSQREIGIDSLSFARAMKHVVRQDPDIILIGEMRDPDTFRAAISASETGHLVISTLHTTDVMSSIDRLLDFFPIEQHDSIRALLALNLKAVTAQRLLHRADGKGLVPAVELMIVTPALSKIIHDNRLTKIPTAVQGGKEEGMQTFNQDMVRLVQEKLITEEEAYANSSSPESLRMNLQGIYLDEERSILGD